MYLTALTNKETCPPTTTEPIIVNPTHNPKQDSRAIYSPFHIWFNLSFCLTGVSALCLALTLSNPSQWTKYNFHEIFRNFHQFSDTSPSPRKSMRG